MITTLFKPFRKSRFGGIRIVPENAPSLYQECVKEFVAEVNRTNQNGKRVSELQFLPTAALVNIFEEISRYPTLREVLRAELSDPVLFMRIFDTQYTKQRIVDRCLLETGFSGTAVLPVLSKNYCDMVSKESLKVGSPPFMKRLLGTVKLGVFLYEAGWAKSSVDVLNIAKNMISLIKNNRFHKKLELDCIQHLLRAQGSCSSVEANETCDTLLGLIADVTDGDTLVKAYLQVANHHYRAERFDECHEWTIKTMNLITDTTPMDDVIELLQLLALFCFSKQRHDLGIMLISNAMHRARSHHGTLHRQYADVLQTYGECLLKMNAMSASIPIFMELLDITTQLYGYLTPHVPVIHGYLALGMYHRSQTTGRFDMAYEQIDRAITMAKQLMPCNKKLQAHFVQMRAQILKGHDKTLAATKECTPPKAAAYASFSFPEIRERYLELDASFEQEAIA